METRILRYFLVVAKQGTISAAARELHISQPTLSRQIQQLETQLNTPLFTRERRRMYLTKAGSAYEKKIRRIIAELDQANQMIANINNNDLTGTIHIGCVESEVTKLLLPQLIAFHRQYPHVRYDFYDADGEDIQERMDQGNIELGVVCAPISTVKYHTLKLPIQDRWGLLVKSDSKLAHHQVITAEDLQNLPLIIPHRALFYDDLNELVQGRELEIVAESNLLTNASYLAQAGIGNIVCIEEAPRPSSTNLKFIPFSPERRQTQFLIWPKGNTLTEATQRFIEKLQTIYA
ncbi:LysR family transcriptional regulator [Limosilactobacillus panis]|uniref:LysR family transcriptional regulator n=1 Tax=Limosilactobacillus panis DSM 6035 TaxID=1423782 RepID=A0A0R1X5A2_9LACO|nr:LysR family transcriptional regulator [Limosilactobacillus panis]KRM25342.1 LysR family transcriptional regulator [Limosilactobacillus panis DSM 6035]